MTPNERHELERTLLEKIQQIGESVREVTPPDGHLSMTWFPNGHMHVLIFNGVHLDRPAGIEQPTVVIDAWAETENGELQVHRL